MSKAQKKQLLHVGCGSEGKEKLPSQFQGEEWEEIRLDINPDVNPDICTSMLDMSMVKKNSMDALYASHNLEHLYLYEVQKALEEFFRVLKPNGIALIGVPDVQSVAAYVAEGLFDEPLYNSSAGSITPSDMLYGYDRFLSQGNHFMAHKGGFTARSIAQQLIKAGFSNIVIRREWVEMWVTAVKLPKTHPERRETASVRTTKFTGPAGQNWPLWYQRKLLLSENPQFKTDELNNHPQIWKEGRVLAD